MDRSGVKKNFPHGGGLFCHKNQSCSKLPEMDRSGVKQISFMGGGGGVSATKTKVAWNCLKWIDLVSKKISLIGGGAVSATKTKVTWNCLKWIDLVSKKISLIGGGAFLPSRKQCEVQWCVKYWCVKLHHVPWHELSISPKGRKEGGAFRPIWTNLRFRRMNNIGLSYTKDQLARPARVHLEKPLLYANIEY